MYAELIINIEAALSGTFHYHVPKDLRSRLEIGHLVEVEFGRRLAQGVVVAFSEHAPVEDTKPVIALIDQEPVVRSWQIDLAYWLSEQYLAPLNSCLRLTLPPGLTRWADITLDINPYWDGNGRLTEIQTTLIELLREKGDLRGRQINRALPKAIRKDWKRAADQLVRRDILRKASVLDPPRVRPKVIRTAVLSAGRGRIWVAAGQLGRANKEADVLHYLATSKDPLPTEADLLTATGAQEKHLKSLAKAGYIQRTIGETIAVPAVPPIKAPEEVRPLLRRLPSPLPTLTEAEEAEITNLASEGLVQLVTQPATVGLAVQPKVAISHVFRLRQGKKYEMVLNYLAQAASPVSLTDLYAATNSTMHHLRKLVKLNLIRFGDEEVWRDPLADRDFVPTDAPRLTKDQARVWGRLKMAMIEAEEEEEQPPGGSTSEYALFQKATAFLQRQPPGGSTAPKPVLLHGVTGSGKTEIYMRAIDHAIQEGKRAIVLVPEIALTPQTVRRFAARFPGQVAVWHSRLTDGERYDTWRRARQGDFDIIVGPRSALFTPLENLGVIVLDEEHDPSYKQTPPVPAPYYHAREAAMALGRLTGAIVILGSATPDLVTYHQAQAGRYKLLELPRRIMGHRRRVTGQSRRLNRESLYHHLEDDPDETMTIPLPPIQIVDLRQELRAGNRSIFSRSLQTQMDETLERGEQAILFLNRRGTASFVMCRDCGYVLKCPRCEMPLTYHRPGMMLSCHYCGRKEPPHKECPQCGSKRIKYFGLGTEEVERLVQQQWPDARTVRWDRDTTAGRDTHEALLSSFINQEADILVGTQMIAKGLGFAIGDIGGRHFGRCLYRSA